MNEVPLNGISLYNTTNKSTNKTLRTTNYESQITNNIHKPTTVSHQKQNINQDIANMIDSSIPYHMSTTAVESKPKLTDNNTMLDPSIAELHGGGSNDSKQDTKGRRDSVYSEDTHFTTLSDPVEPAPPVIVFFSFMNSHSYDWAVKHEIVNNIRRNVPQGTSIVRYHAPMRFSWDFGENLTHAWAAAESLHVDDQIIAPMFKAIHDKQVTDLEGIRTVFEQVGIPPDTLLREWGKTWVLGHKYAMDKAVAHLDLKDVPGILVKGKYMVNLDSFGDAWNADQAVNLVKDLLARE